MTQGRPRKPTQQLKEEGSFRSDRHAGRLDEAMGGGLPSPPFPLSENEQWAWNLVCNNLPADVLSEIDALAIFGLSKFYGRWVQLMEKAEKEPDNLQASAMAIGAWKQVSQVLGKFGMSPADRAKIQFNSMVQITVSNGRDETDDEEEFERGLDEDLQAELGEDG